MQPNDALPLTAAPLETWGGVECSHVRIDGADRDQCAESGHWDRPADLDLIARLGLAKLRYPLLWARAARPGGGFDFAADAARFERLRALGQRPIAGFLHHGWGPGGLDPLDPGFVPGLAAFAEAAAARFDWIEDFTPINEPVTTARFSYLYGHWHPHLGRGCSRRACGRARSTRCGTRPARRSSSGSIIT